MYLVGFPAIYVKQFVIGRDGQCALKLASECVILVGFLWLAWVVVSCGSVAVRVSKVL